MIKSFMTGALLGSALMYLYDPELGADRRAQLAQQLQGTADRVQRVGKRQAHYFADQAEDVQQKVRQMRDEDAHPSPERLKARVESELFRDPTVPKGTLNVNVEGGTVVLRGHVQDAALRRRLEAHAHRVSGVDAVENRIRLDDEKGHQPG